MPAPLKISHDSLVQIHNWMQQTGSSLADASRKFGIERSTLSGKLKRAGMRKAMEKPLVVRLARKVVKREKVCLVNKHWLSQPIRVKQDGISAEA